MSDLTRRAALAGAASLAACANTPLPMPALGQAREGRVAVEGGEVVWRRFGGGPKTPLLVVHGGPGVPSDYLEPLAALGDERPVYMWDQLGCGRSDRPSNPALWTRERFVSEMAEVRRALRLRRVHILGQSWGTMLTTDYLLANGIGGVRSVVLAGPVLSMRRYVADLGPMIAELAPEHRATIQAAEASGAFDTPAYRAATEAFYAAHIARSPSAETGPLLQRAFEGIGQETYVAMNGPSEFSPLGSLRDYERVADLARLTMPVLYLSGEYDTCTPGASREYAAATPRAEVAVIPRSGHLTTIDAPDATNHVVRSFLHRVES